MQSQTAVGLGLWGGGVNVYGGNDTVYAASLKLDVYDTWGNLSVLDMPAPVNEIFPE
jgi:hypothetical protein